MRRSDDKKMSDNRLLQIACHYAEQYELSFIDALQHCTSPDDIEARERAEDFVRRIRAYQKRRWPVE